MKLLRFIAHSIVVASKGNPTIAGLACIILFFLFNLAEGAIEIMVFGERFVHWFDVLWISLHIIFLIWVFNLCAQYQLQEKRNAHRNKNRTNG